MIIGTGNGMNIKKSKQPSKHLKLLKPNRFGKDRTEQKLQNFQKHLKNWEHHLTSIFLRNWFLIWVKEFKKQVL
ncbi:hypothetical protein LEP1GSC037_4109 [Leptospira interrogans str. 2006001854]|uniref:Uncharacterized protein n=1 Tax=Leptospira interrogans str. 2006001854 TaxID=1001590 RepID=M6GG57_LEPIR|nr:hypothetical protein LEP1GSC037_4109 [Leptospira interrogans str. 2006001854]